jgi:tetratricopeptide (TPR) repeat protein
MFSKSGPWYVGVSLVVGLSVANIVAPSHLFSEDKEAKEAQDWIDEVTREIENSPRPSDLYVERGDIYLSLRKFALARDDFTRAIKSSRSSPYDALIRRFDASMELGDYEKALADAREASKIQRALPYALLAMVQAGCPEEHLRDAKESLDNAQLAAGIARREGTDEIVPERALAAAYSCNGDFASAILHQEKAIRLMDDNVSKDDELWLSRYKAKKPYRIVSPNSAR